MSVNIHKSGFVLINVILGASPDGFSDNFVVEIKCPAKEKAVHTYAKDGNINKKLKHKSNAKCWHVVKKKDYFVLLIRILKQDPACLGNL